MPFGNHWLILLVLAVIALIIFGPARLPELGSGLGKAIKEFRKATSEMGEGLKDELRKTETPTGTTYTQPATTTAGTPVEPAPIAASPAVTPAASPPPEAPKV